MKIYTLFYEDEEVIESNDFMDTRIQSPGWCYLADEGDTSWHRKDKSNLDKWEFIYEKDVPIDVRTKLLLLQ